MTEMSVETALTGFLADRREHGSQRQFREAEKVITTLRYSIDKDADQPADDIPVNEITGHIGHLIVEVLPHEEFATVSQLKAVRRVLSSLLRWLGEHGYLDADAVTDAIDDMTYRLDDAAEVARGVEALQSCVRRVSRDVLDTVPYSDWIADQSMYVDEVTAESITFSDVFHGFAWAADADVPGSQRVGPVAVPPEVAEVVAPGWTILLSAARINGEWCLLNVVSGDP